MTQALALEMASVKVNVNAICPGLHRLAMLETNSRSVPLGRTAVAQDPPPSWPPISPTT